MYRKLKPADIPSKCAVCRKDVLVDQFDSGSCGHCGWQQSWDAIDHPDIVRYPNRVSYNKAKQLYKEGKPFLPSLDDFVGMLNFYAEVEFMYNGGHYGVIRSGGKIVFYEFNVDEGQQIYSDTDEFIEKAHIGGVLLRKIWCNVENADYMGC